MATLLRSVCSSKNLLVRALAMSPNGGGLLSVAGLKNFPRPPSYQHIVMPEDVKLPFLPKNPQFVNSKPRKHTTSLHLIRGEEELHTDLHHNQYGIIALNGSFLEWGHYDMMRTTINRSMDTKKMFAVWRIGAPWLSRFKKGIGNRMGGGKGNIHRYVYPVKRDRIILEMGGKVSFEEVLPILRIVAAQLPFEAEAISAEKLAHKREMRKKIAAANINPVSFKYLIQNNLLGCERWATKMDKIYFGTCV